MTRKLTPAQLDEIEAAAKAATPGPWVAEYGGGEEVVLPSDALSTLEAVCVTKLFHRQADAKHIAGLSPDVALALVSEVRELRAKVERVQELHGRAGDGPDAFCEECEERHTDRPGWKSWPCDTIKALGEEA